MKAKLLLLTGLLFTLVGCQNAQHVFITPPKNIHLDKHFESDHQIETTEQIFAASPEMLNYIERRLDPVENFDDKIRVLMTDLFSPDMLNIGYQHDATLTASETFEKGIANCMSLTLMSYVIAREARLGTAFYDVKVQENWSQVNGITMLNGHVNLKVFRSDLENMNVINFVSRVYTIDFLPLQASAVISSHRMVRPQIVALFYNNKGANALANGQPKIAYQYFKAATQSAPELSAPWGNLASLYRQHGHYQAAENIYQYALEIDPKNLNLHENLALLYMNTDRAELASEILHRIDVIRRANPYYYAMKAEELHFYGDYEGSNKQYRKALELNKHNHQFYYGMAKNFMKLNQFEQATSMLKKAERKTKENNEREKYQHKIQLLQQLTANRR